jgi:hypothetical protein
MEGPMPSAADLEAAADKLAAKGRTAEAGDKYEEAAAAREAEGNPGAAAQDHEFAARVHEGLAAQAKANGNAGAEHAEAADAKSENTKAADDWRGEAAKRDSAGDTAGAAAAWDAAARAYAKAKEWSKCAASHEAAALRMAQLAGPHESLGHTLESIAKAKEKAARNYEKMSDPGNKPGAAELDRLAALWYDLAAKDENQASDELGIAAKAHQRAAKFWYLAWAAYKDAGDNAAADRAAQRITAEDDAWDKIGKEAGEASRRADADQRKFEDESREAERDK